MEGMTWGPNVLTVCEIFRTIDPKLFHKSRTEDIAKVIMNNLWKSEMTIQNILDDGDIDSSNMHANVFRYISDMLVRMLEYSGVYASSAYVNYHGLHEHVFNSLLSNLDVIGHLASNKGKPMEAIVEQKTNMQSTVLTSIDLRDIQDKYCIFTTKTNMYSTVRTFTDLRDIQDKYPGISTQTALNVWSSMQQNKLIQSDNYRSTKSQRAERIGRKLHTYAGTELRTRPRDCLSFVQYVEISTLDAGTASIFIMEEYVRESPRASNVRKNLVIDEIGVGVASHTGVRVYNVCGHGILMVGCESMKIYNAISEVSI
ncbi:hypothetical protein Tco_1417798 [Tanacetum coccineum]